MKPVSLPSQGSLILLPNEMGRGVSALLEQIQTGQFKEESDADIGKLRRFLEEAEYRSGEVQIK